MPALDVSALRTQLKSGKLAPVYLFRGEDTKLIDRVMDAVESTIDPADRPFSIERMYAGEPGASPIDIAASARVYPMLGDRRIVFVLRAERLLKPKRAGRTPEVEPESRAEGDAEDMAVDFTPLEEYLAAPVPSTTLVFVATEVDKTRRFTKRLIEKAQDVVFGGLDGEAGSGRRDPRADAVALVKEELAREGRAMDPAALDLLVDRSGGDVTKLRGDLERLLLYTRERARVSADDVSEVASIEVAPDAWALVNAIGDNDTARALREAAHQLDRGDSVHAMVGQLRWWVSNRLSERAPARVVPAIEALLRTDLALKSSTGDERILIERLVVELTAPLRRQG